jgi:signal transduction histidine kinase
MADPELLQRILCNPVSNAVQAMPDGGKLQVSAYQEADISLIEVQDTGSGIADEAKYRLFTPLFITKAKGQGFGLAGLNVWLRL